MVKKKFIVSKAKLALLGGGGVHLLVVRKFPEKQLTTNAASYLAANTRLKFHNKCNRVTMKLSLKPAADVGGAFDGKSWNQTITRWA